MKKIYHNPQVIVCDSYAIELMQASGVYGDGAASDITYGGVEENGKEPEAKSIHESVWDE